MDQLLSVVEGWGEIWTLEFSVKNNVSMFFIDDFFQKTNWRIIFVPIFRPFFCLRFGFSMSLIEFSIEFESVMQKESNLESRILKSEKRWIEYRIESSSLQNIESNLKILKASNRIFISKQNIRFVLWFDAESNLKSNLKIIAFLSDLRFDAESYDSTITGYFQLGKFKKFFWKFFSNFFTKSPRNFSHITQVLNFEF